MSTGFTPNAQGHKHHGSKFTPQQVRAIRRFFESGEWTQKDLAARYKTTPQTIHRITHRLSYVNVA